MGMSPARPQPSTRSALRRSPLTPSSAAVRGARVRAQAVVHLSVVVIGVGSAAFHATLQHVAQQADETPMVWSMLVWTYAVWQPELGLSRGAERLWVVGSSAFAVVFAVVHYEYRFVLAFQVLFGVLVVINLYRIFTRWFPRVRGEPGSRMKGLYWQTMLLAFACWMGDQHLCHHASAMPINPQGHAFWHLLMAASSYIGPTLIQFEHARLLGWDPVWEWTAFGLLPYPVPRKTQRK